MQPFALQPEEVTAEVVTGAVLCHDLVAATEEGRVKLRKGTVLAPRDVPPLRSWEREIHLLRLDPGDVHEDVAALRLANAVMGEGLEQRGPTESQVHLRSTARGVFRADVAALEALDALPDVSIFSQFDGQPVTPGTPVAAAKITPLAIPGEVLCSAEEIARQAHPVFTVLPFRGATVAVVVRERLTSGARGRFESALTTKLGWFGSPLLPVAYVPDEVEAIEAAVRTALDANVGLVLAAGVNSTDPLDLTVQAVERLGAHTEARGVPAHPGSTCWLAYCDSTPIFGLALCGMFSRSTALDLLLPRFLAGCHVTAAEVARLGHGGLLREGMAFRFPDYGE